jgi:hypothetical protein
MQIQQSQQTFETMKNLIALKTRMGTENYYKSLKWAMKSGIVNTVQGAVNYLYWAKYNNQ